MDKHIPNAELKSSDVPLGAGWEEFALTFSGYEVSGGFDECAEIANKRTPKTLTEYRTCLFFEQRRWRHFGEAPAGKDWTYIRSLLKGIREKVEKGELT